MPLLTVRIIADWDATLVTGLNGPMDASSAHISAIRDVAIGLLKRLIRPAPFWVFA